MTEGGIRRKVLNLTILGESDVGKTCICEVFLGLDFKDTLTSTIGVEKMQYKMKMDDGEEMKIKIWDTAGQERFHSIAVNSIKNSQGIAVVFDVTKKITFQKVENWLTEIREESLVIPIVLFGNKCDITDQREVTKEEAQKFADEQNLMYFETSAKLNQGITEGFTKLANEGYKKLGTKKGVKVGEDEDINKVDDGGCCLKKNKNKKNNNNKK